MALAIIGLAMAVVIPAVGHVSRAELRQAASELSGTIRASYDSAALSGSIHRLEFALNKSTIAIRKTDAPVQIDSDNSLVTGAKAAAQGAPSALSLFGVEGGATGENSQPATDPMSALLGLSNLNVAGDSEQFVEARPSLQLPEGVRLMDVWVDGMDEPAREGDVFLYFFPGGQTQDAIIHLEDDNGNVYSIVTAALTGRTTVENGYRERKK